MKRYNCTSSDKRGAFGLCMEEHKEGAFVPFSEVGPLNQRINQLLEERNGTGLVISNAILSGVVPDKHPLRPRLELLANHHKREQELTAQLENANRQIGVMAELLRDVRSDLSFFRDVDPERIRYTTHDNDPINRIDSVLAGKLPTNPVTVTETIRTAPERIWLQVGDQSHYHSEPFPSYTSDVSWCSESMMACEVQYVRADLAGNIPAPVGGEMRTVTVSGKGLLELVEFACPDHETDRDQQETEIVLLNREAFTSTDGEKMPRGVYAYLAEYPEEGLYGPIGGVDPQGGAPCDTGLPLSKSD